MATEAGVVPKKGVLSYFKRLREQSLVCSRSLDDKHTYKGVLSHLSLTLRSTSLCSIRYLNEKEKRWLQKCLGMSRSFLELNTGLFFDHLKHTQSSCSLPPSFLVFLFLVYNKEKQLALYRSVSRQN